MSAAARWKREARARRQRLAEQRRLSSDGAPPRILQVIEQPKTAPVAKAQKAPPLPVQSRDAINQLRMGASRTGGHAAAGLLHLADLLTFHRTGFPNVREVRW